jgi:indoleamine 2,3-dioxygenase
MDSLKHSYTDGFFDVSAKYGFLPVHLPLEKLPERYAALQALLDAMPVVLPDGRHGLLNEPGSIESAVGALPNYLEQVNTETDKLIQQALYRGYCFLASAYTLEPSFQVYRLTGKYGKARNVLPPQIAQPFVAAAEKMEVYPWLDYHYAYSLGNYRKKDPKGGLTWENLDMCVRFSGQPDEVGFIMLHVDINQYSPTLVGSVMEALDAAVRTDTVAVESALDRNLETMIQMNIRRKEMWKASRWQHYNDFRVFIMGVKGNEELFGPGVIYEGVWKEPQQFRGQTGAQDDIIPMEDIFSGVVNYYPKNELTKYLLDLRTYRPKCIQQFFMDLESTVGAIHSKGIAGYLTEAKSLFGLVRLLGILEQIYHFRNGHWQFVQKYIMANTQYAKATGGTPITSWLPNQLKAVMHQMEDVIGWIDEIGMPADESSKRILDQNRSTLSHKKNLLEEQLALVAEQHYSAQKVFELNERYGLKDEQE